ncbi:hypothetical protein Patl1_13640 [Pistacia atlantica]|uniref:Uncharacterized protein n=1 Tax=Pistacia atlantica TaxID=434234 RepID=A0ACC1AW15_9ROSI|nr:hypothetical protein Patl1_13640 [Pistacia atlantica]
MEHTGHLRRAILRQIRPLVK